MDFLKYTWQGITFWRSLNKSIQINKKHYAAFDLESTLFFNNIRIKSESDFRILCQSLKTLDNDTRAKFSTAAWCYLCYDDYNGFCAFNKWDDIYKYFEFTQTKLIWDFNLKFDGSFLDYLFYFNPLYSDRDKKSQFYYENLLSSSGQRYSLTITHNKKQYRIVDFSNILRSSIAQIAIDFNITLDNEAVNKKTMDYFKVTWDTVTQDDLNYCFTDVYILYNAVKKFNVELKNINPDFSLTGEIKKNIPLTSSSIAKTILLDYIYGKNTKKNNIDKYHRAHPIKIGLDEFYRQHGLYKGGLTFINNKYKGKLLNRTIRIYDVNSEYPFVMSQLNDLKGKPYIYSYEDYLKSDKKDQYIAILFFSELHMEVKKNMVPCFFYKGDNVDYLNFKNDEDIILMFECEFLNIQQFYNIKSFKIKFCHLYYKGDKIYNKFVTELYHLRQTTKNKTQRNLIKLILNSSYGKLGQKIKQPIIEQYLKDNTVTFRVKRNKKKEIQYQNSYNNKMSVVNAAYITANARCYIRNKIIEVSNGNVAKNFIYCDTDSVHTFNEYKNTSSELGGLKEEDKGIQGKYLKPKTYILKREDGKYKISSKGINKKSLNGYLDENFIDMFNYDQRFYSLSSILVKGGRALILINKNLGAKE